MFHKKNSICYFDYKVIPNLLNWIDCSLSYEFQNDLDKIEKSTHGYIYIVQFNEDKEKNIMKIGRTYNIKERYKGKQYKIIKLKHVEDM